MKTLNCHYLISVHPILLKFIGMMQWAIESLHTNFQAILRSFIF